MSAGLKLLPLLRGSPLTFPLAALASLALFLISESSYQQATSRLDALGREGEARATIQVLRRTVTDAENGERGFLLTGRADGLAAYNQGRVQAQEALQWLNRHYGGDPDTAPAMNRVDAAARGTLSVLAQTLRLHDAGDERGWRELVLSNVGEEQMQSMRLASAALLALEEGRTVHSRASVLQTMMLNRVGVSLMAALSLLALYMYLRQTTALVRLREEQRRRLQVERDQLGDDVIERTRQLTALTRHLQTVREDERNHLARELHDELGALLTAAKLDVARLKSRLGVPSPEVAERLAHLVQGLNSGIALKRRIVEDLRPSSLSNLGLVAALEILVREWSAGTDIPVDTDFEMVALTPSSELTVYRMVQESLTNISKYAQAHRVQVRLVGRGPWVTVTVEDDGVGFDVAAPRQLTHGLLGMRYRLEAEGGRLVLRSAPGHGTTVQAELPRAAPGVPEPQATRESAGEVES